MKGGVMLGDKSFPIVAYADKMRLKKGQPLRYIMEVVGDTYDLRYVFRNLGFDFTGFTWVKEGITLGEVEKIANFLNLRLYRGKWGGSPDTFTFIGWTTKPWMLYELQKNRPSLVKQKKAQPELRLREVIAKRKEFLSKKKPRVVSRGKIRA